MIKKYELEIDGLAVGLTKPPSKFGVPLVSLYLSMMVCFFAWMFYQTISASTSIVPIIGFIALWAVIYLVMFFLTFKDPFGLRIAWMNVTSFRKHRTHRFWGNTDSYAP